MTWNAILSAFLLALLVPVGMILAFPAIWLLNSAVHDVWQLPMLARLQPQRTWWRLGLAVIGLLFLLNVVLGPAHIAGKLLASIVLAARPTLWWVRGALWKQVPTETRMAAADVRKELNARENTLEIIATRPWPSFVFDIERARRRAEYDPSPI